MPSNFSQALVSHAVEPLGWLMVIVLVFGGLKLLFLAKVKGKVGEALVAQKLKRFGEVLNDIILPGKEGQLTQIDHLVRLPHGILVVETKNYQGKIFGREREPQWTQRLGGQSFKFKNPLHQNYGHIQAVRALVPGVPVMGRVVFLGSAEFPKGVPAGVSTLGSLENDLAKLPHNEADAKALSSAWLRLKGAARTDNGSRKTHLQQVQERHGKGLRHPVGIAMLTVAGLIAGLLLIT